MNTKPRTFIFGLLLLTPPLQAGEGTDGFLFADRDVGVREAALGEAGAADPQGAESLLRHPAGLGTFRGRTFSAGYASHFLSMSEGGLAYAHSFDKGAAALGARQFSSGDISGYTGGDARTSSFQVKDAAAALAYGRPLSRRVSLGVTVKELRETIGTFSARTTAADLGLHVRPTWEDVSLPVQLAFEVRHLGSGGTFRREKTALPQTIVAAAAWKGFRGAVNLLADWRRTEAGGNLNLGAEAWIKNLMALRLGRVDGRASGGGLTAGVGFRLPGITVDYAFTTFGDSFGAAHRAGVSFRFGGAGDKAYQEGLRLLQDGQYAESILKFQSALDADPENGGAVRALREAVGALERAWPEGGRPADEKSPGGRKK